MGIRVKVPAYHNDIRRTPQAAGILLEKKHKGYWANYVKTVGDSRENMQYEFELNRKRNEW